MEGVEYNEALEEQIVDEEYKIWKKNSPFLYDLVMTKPLVWPSLTVQWLPQKHIPDNCDYSQQKVILGTLTSGGEQNYLMVAHVKMPLDETPINIKQYVDNTTSDCGGFGFSDTGNNIEVEIRINHDGEVNRARFMPQKPNIIATKTVSGEVHIFDTSKHPAKPENDVVKPQLRLTGHTKEGYGLSWSDLKESHLLSGSDDHLINLWDVGAAKATHSNLEPTQTFNHHTDVVEDVAWHRKNESVFGSVGDDKKILLWDTRQTPEKPMHSIDGHTQDINTIDFNPFNEHLFVTGSADKSVALWDKRNLKIKLHSFVQHTNEVCLGNLSVCLDKVDPTLLLHEIINPGIGRSVESFQ